jgi:two-component sensor histidine kinase
MRAEADRAMLDEARRRADLQETLLRELHHRVKNSLMTVQSLIRMQGAGPEAAETLQRRVLALAQVHDLLHVAHLASRLDLAAFLRRLCADPALLPTGARLRLSCDVAPVEVGVELASPLALVVVELLTNAARHAFPDGRAGHVTVTLRAADGQGVLTVADDGVGLPEPSVRRRHSGLGLVERLVAQIHGRLTVRSEGGTAFELTFPLDRAG